MSFKIGDKVKAVKTYDQVKKGMTGVVKKVSDLPRNVGVVWNGLGSGHDLGGLTKGRNGYNVPVAYVKRTSKERPVNFLLKYDLDADPVEEFETLAEVKARIEELVKDKDDNGLQLDSIVVYEIKSSTKVIVETTVVIKGI